MDFRTKVDIPRSDLNVSHKSRLLMMGSCFIENMGKMFVDNKFNVNLNPFGVLYNPKSIAQGLRLLIDRKKFSENDIFEHKGLYHSFYHHSSFSDINKEKCLDNINGKLSMSSSDLRQADVLFITFGTAYVYQSKEQGIVVGNCHKLPASDFDRYRLSVDEIVQEWSVLIKDLKSINSSLKIVFTVSPIRHFKDGAHENQLSKSILLLAMDELMRSNPGLYYFPSYEIVLDELRDYRFYNEDMIHPSPMAISYIWERLSETYFAEEVSLIIEEWRKIYLALNHRPFNSDTDEYKHFLRQTMLKLKTFNNKYPYICCEDEISALESRI